MSDARDARPPHRPGESPAAAGDRIADALVLTFTTDMSLRAWRVAGMLKREWAIYERVRARYGRVVLVTYGGPDEAEAAQELGVEVVCNEGALEPGMFMASIPGRVAGLLGGARTAVVKTNQMMGGQVALGVARALRAGGVRVGLIARGGYLWSRFVAWDQGPASAAAREAAMLERELCAAADVVVGTSQAMIGDLAWRYGLDPERTMLVPNYVLPDIGVRLPAERERGTILYAGQLVDRKRVDILLQALALLKEMGSAGARLSVIGAGPEEGKLKALATALGVEATFEPRIAHGELLERMGGCTIFAQASSMEGHPKTVIEAMATGAPVVVAEAPGLARVVQHGVTGLVMPAQPEAFARAFEGLLSDEAWREALGTAAAADVNAKLGLDLVLTQEIGVHRRALDLGGSCATPPVAQVRFDPELLLADMGHATGVWARAIGGFARRLAPRKRAEFLLGLDTPLYHMQGAAAIEADGGLHPKHRLLKYHDFFVDRIAHTERVLDLGTGNGALACSIAACSGAEVVGMDWSKEQVERASRMATEKAAGLRLAYRVGDITKDRCEGRFDTIVLSNVLEHITERPQRLMQWRRWYGATRFLIRVPAFDREWRAPFKKELGVEWRLDDTHETEYTYAQLEQELREAGLRITECVTRWGEYWVAAEPAVAAAKAA